MNICLHRITKITKWSPNGKTQEKKIDYSCRILQYPINLLEDFTCILFKEIDDINWEVRADLVQSDP